MASILKVGSKWRALVRKAGLTRCQTFSTKPQAKDWATTVEQEIDQLKSTGYLQPKGLTVGDLFDRYVKELYPLKQWGRSKSADLKLLKAEFGSEPVANLTHERLLEGFKDMYEGGAGGVTLSSRTGYLITVLSTAKDVWRLNVPLNAAKSARNALTRTGMIKKGARRSRRVSDAEIDRIIKHIERKDTSIPIAAVLWFSVASAMRISETCRLLWEDLNETDRTIRIRDRKHPTAKIGNHQTVPLLILAGHDAYAIVTAQPMKSKRIFPVNSKTVSTYFTDAVAELEIADLHLHDLRHEAISRLFEAGYRIEEVSLVSGHRDWSMLKRYTHLRAVNLHKVRAA